MGSLLLKLLRAGKRPGRQKGRRFVEGNRRLAAATSSEPHRRTGAAGNQELHTARIEEGSLLRCRLVVRKTQLLHTQHWAADNCNPPFPGNVSVRGVSNKPIPESQTT